MPHSTVRLTTAHLAPLPAEKLAAASRAADWHEIGAALHELRASTGAGRKGSSELTADLRDGLPGLSLATSDFEGAPCVFFGAGGLLEYIAAAARPAERMEPVAASAPLQPGAAPVQITAEVSVSRRDRETVLARAFLCALPLLAEGCGAVSCAAL